MTWQDMKTAATYQEIARLFGDDARVCVDRGWEFEALYYQHCAAKYAKRARDVMKIETGK